MSSDGLRSVVSYNVCYSTRICCVNGLGGYKCYDT